MSIYPCKVCGAPIILFETESGQRIPLDLIPVPDGNMVIVAQTAVRFDPEKHGELARYVSHFATCFGADGFRAARKKREVKSGTVQEDHGGRKRVFKDGTIRQGRLWEDPDCD